MCAQNSVKSYEIYCISGLRARLVYLLPVDGFVSPRSRVLVAAAESLLALWLHCLLEYYYTRSQ